MNEFVVHTSLGKPFSIEEWNLIANSNGNLLQHTNFDSVQSFYNHVPIYFELYHRNDLLGGIKCYRWESNKIGRLTKSLSKKLIQHGEAIFISSSEEQIQIYILELKNAVQKYIDKQKIVQFTSGGFYGNTNLLLNLEKYRINYSEFYTSFVEIDKIDSDLLKSFNRNTNRNIKKAIQTNLIFSLTNDVERFLQIENQVYLQQSGVAPPNFDFIRHIVRSLEQQGSVQMGIVSNQDEDLAGGLFYKCGEVVYSVFGGAVKNSLGAGHYFYYEMMRFYRTEGVRKFYFGQIAKQYDKKNEKFSVGITNFKRGFGCIELKTNKSNYVLKPFHFKIWNILVSIILGKAC